MTSGNTPLGNTPLDSQFGFARKLPAEPSQQPPILENQRRLEVLGSRDAGSTSHDKQDGQKLPSAFRQVRPQRRRLPVPERQRRPGPECSEDAGLTSFGKDGEPKLWFALGLASLTYAVGLAGFWSIYQTLDILQ